MDPEVIAQLEERFRELTEVLARQTAMMNSQMEAMNKVASSAKSASDATNKNTTNTTQSTTKYAEAQAKATTETDKSAVASKALAAGFGTLSASVSGLLGTFGALGSSLLSAEQGLSKYGKVADSAASAAEGLTRSIPIVGDALGGLVGVVGKVAAQLLTDGLKLVDTFANMRDGLVEVGGALPVTGEQLIKLASNAGYYGERMQILGKITQGLGTNLVGLSTTAGQGAAKFMEMSAVGEQVIRQYGKLGISQERLTEMQGLYIKSQIISGNANELQAKTAGQLRRESLAYVDNMTKLSALTGKQAEQMQSEQEAALSEFEELVKQRQENAQIAQLKRDNRHEEAAQIKKEQQNRVEFLKEAATVLTPADAARLGRMARTGTYDQFTSGLAVLGISAAELKRNMQTAVSGSEIFSNTYGELNQKTGEMAQRAGDALQFMGEEGAGGIGVYRGILEANRKYGDKSLADAKAQAEQDLEIAKSRNDAISEAEQNLKSQERQFQAAYQEQLLKGVVYLADAFKNVDLFNTVAQNFTGILSGLAAAIAGVTALSGGMAISGAMLAGRMMGAGGGGGGGGGLLRSGLGLLGKAGLVGMGITGAIGAYQGYNADPNASFGGKLLNAGSSALNMLSFGLLGSSSGQIANAAVANADPGSIAKLQEAQIDRTKENTTVVQNQSDIGKTLSKTFTDFNTIMLTTNKQMKDFNESLEGINQSLIGGGIGGSTGGGGGGAAGGGGGAASGDGLISKIQQLSDLIGGMTGGGGGGNSPPGPDSKLLDFIGNLESGNNYNMLVGGRVKSDTPLTAMTVREVLEFQRTMKARGHESTALGKYQIIRSTLQGIVNAGILKLDDRFDQANQDKAATYLLDLRGRQAYKTGKITAAQYADNLSKEWAALPYSTGRSYYAGVGSNKSHVSRGEFINALQAREGGIFSGPDSGYPIELHGTEMILPLDSGTIRGNKVQDILSSLTTVGEKQNGIGKNKRIHDVLLQIVNNETTKAIQAVNEANSPMKNISNEISNSMRQIMEAHNHTMNELTYKLGDMINALNTSNDVTKKILKKASA